MNENFNLSDQNKLSFGTNLKLSRQINILSAAVFILTGIFFHSLVILVFSLKKFRTNSSNVFLLCLAINDILYLINYFFEHTIITYIDIYVENDKGLFNKLILAINLAEKSVYSCRIINYLMYSLRFNSAYILCAINLQRLFIVCKPLKNESFNKKHAWISVGLITLTSFLSNTWFLFAYELNSEIGHNVCDIKQELSLLFFRYKAVYIFATILVPILFTLIVNANILSRLKMKSKERALLVNRAQVSKHKKKRETNDKEINKVKMKHIQNYKSQKVFNRLKSSDSKRLIILLICVSFIYVLFNLPYALIWIRLIYKVYRNEAVSNENGYIYIVFQIFETIYNINFSSLFFLYCITAAKFRYQLRHITGT